MTVVERAALAMAQLLLPEQETAAVGELEGTKFRYIDVDDVDLAVFARAAIAALREPDPQLVARIVGSSVEDIPEQAHFVMLWQHMIDAMVAEAVSPTPTVLSALTNSPAEG
jgi:hypothetical protein